jgi:hypothetical protein
MADGTTAPFWGDGTYGVQPPLTDGAVADAERVLGVRLPGALLDLLRVQNGGTVAPGRRRYPTDTPTSWAADHVPFAELMGIGRAAGTPSLLDTPYLVREWGLPAAVVLLSGTGHFWIALDYRAREPRAEPSVTWFDTEMGTELALAPDFRAFVDRLVP